MKGGREEERKRVEKKIYRGQKVGLRGKNSRQGRLKLINSTNDSRQYL
jgi:hypothetical protein